MAATAATADPLTRDDARSFFETMCQKLLGISRREFLARHAASNFEGFDHLDVAEVSELLPFAR